MHLLLVGLFSGRSRGRHTVGTPHFPTRGFLAMKVEGDLAGGHCLVGIWIEERLDLQKRKLVCKRENEQGNGSL